MNGRITFLMTIVALALVAIATSLLVIPDEYDLALMNLRAYELAGARVRYERMIDEGDLSVRVVKSLTEIYLRQGDVDDAADLLSRFVETRPSHLEARRTLGVYYQYAQRYDDYRRNLERLIELQLDERALRELATIYSDTGDYERQMSMLEVLLRNEPTRGGDFLDLANLQARLGHFDEAAETLDRFEVLHAAEVNPRTVELKLNVLLDGKHPQRAFGRAGAWLRRRPNADVAARFAAMFHYNGFPELAARLLEPFAAMIRWDPELLYQATQIDVALGDGDGAFRRLLELYRDDRLAERVVPQLVDLALERRQNDLVLELFRGRDLGQLPDHVRDFAIDLAALPCCRELEPRVLAELDEGFLAKRPVAVAAMLFSAGDRPGAVRWAERAARGALDTYQRAQLAFLNLDLGRRQLAYDQLASIVRLGGPGLVYAGALAHMHLDLGLGSRDLALFEQLRWSHDASAAAAWSLVAAAAGRSDEVHVWLRAAGTDDAELLRALFYLASDRGSTALALDAAQRLVRVRPREDDARLLLANALIAETRFCAAIETLQPLVPGSERAESLIVHAVSLGLAEGDELQAEARHLVLRRLGGEPLVGATGPIDPAAVDPELSMLIHLAIELGELDAALPHLARLAATGSAPWTFDYAQALRDAGDRDRLLDYWETTSSDSTLAFETRRWAVQGLLDEQAFELAQRVMLPWVADAPARDPYVEELLHLWSGVPPPEGLLWMASRTGHARGEEQALWIERLVSIGHPALAVSAVERTAPRGPDDPAARIAYLDALALDEPKRLPNAVSRAVSHETDPAALMELGHLALAAELTASADHAFQKILAGNPHDRAARRELGLLAYQRGSYARARENLARSLLGGAADAEALQAYGDVLQQADQPRNARLAFRVALDTLERRPASDRNAAHLRALVMHRLGRRAEGLALLRLELSRSPGNDHLRADYVQLLIDDARLSEADALLSGWVPVTVDPLRGGARRLVLLQAELDLRRLDTARARDRLAGLAHDDPTAPEWPAMLGRLELQNGRVRAAKRFADAASRLDPLNDQLHESRRDLRRTAGSRVEISSTTQRGSRAETHAVKLVSGHWRASDAVIVDGLIAGAALREGSPDARRRLEAGVHVERLDGRWLRVELFSDRQQPGGGLVHGWSRDRMRGSLGLRWNRPYWELTDGVRSDARRSSIRLDQEFQPGASWQVAISAGVNRYEIAGGEHAFDSATLRARASWLRPSRRGALGLEYSLDAERTDGASALLPLYDREVHSVGLVARTALLRGVHGSVATGYARDRLGGDGAFFTGALEIAPARSALGIRLSFERRLDAADTGRITDHARADLVYRFGG